MTNRYIQLSLFNDPSPSEAVACTIVNEVNNLNTVWAGTFNVKDIECNRWEHVNEKTETLTITLQPDLTKGYLVQLKGDSESQRQLEYMGDSNHIIGEMLKDKDFSIKITPWCLYVFYHKFKKKIAFLRGAGVIR